MKVHHIGYLVKNIENAEKDLEQLGYCRKTQVVFDPVRNVDISFWDNEGYCVELVSPKSEASVAYGLMKTCKNKPYHIGYLTACIEEEIERLKEAGYTQIDAPTEAVAIDGKRVCFLMSPNSGMIELVEVYREH